MTPQRFDAMEITLNGIEKRMAEMRGDGDGVPPIDWSLMGMAAGDIIDLRDEVRRLTADNARLSAILAHQPDIVQMATELSAMRTQRDEARRELSSVLVARGFPGPRDAVGLTQQEDTGSPGNESAQTHTQPQVTPCGNPESSDSQGSAAGDYI